MTIYTYFSCAASRRDALVTTSAVLLFTSICWIVIAIQLNEWDFFALPLDLHVIIGSAPVAFGETLWFAGLPVMVGCWHWLGNLAVIAYAHAFV